MLFTNITTVVNGQKQRPIHHRNSGVKVIAINPGLTNTPILGNTRESLMSNSDEYNELFDSFVANFPIQSVDNMGRGLIHVLQNDEENGTMWAVENDKPPRKLKLEYTDA